MKPGNKNSYNSLMTLNVKGKNYKYYSLVEAEKNGLKDISKLPKGSKGSGFFNRTEPLHRTEPFRTEPNLFEPILDFWTFEFWIFGFGILDLGFGIWNFGFGI